ncbi:MAG: chromosomal replication initiator protein DnaA [Candidatus Omnitrophica bacterium]|nr:chromosomal replication initiator protein DnaA [Candidatus Omnitrophota bacterium]
MDIWDQILQFLKDRLDRLSFERWFKPTQLISVSSEMICIGVPNTFFGDWIVDKYGDLLRDALRFVGEGHKTIEYRVIEGSPVVEERLSAASPPSDTKARDRQIGAPLNHKYTFDDFVVGPSNRFAHAATMAVAQTPAKAYNPLFIYGGVGLGKTHLMQSVGHFILAEHPAYTVCYVSSEGFTNQLISAIQHRATARFRERYRKADILLIDDIQFISGKESTQEEFFHTFNTLYDAHKQIVISSDRPPKELKGLEGRLISRFEWGLVTDIQPPGLETRIAILRKKAEKEGIVFADEVLFFLADKIKTNVRELEGALIRVAAYASFMNEAVSLLLAQTILKDILVEEERMILVETIQRVVADEFNTTIADIKSRRRSKQIAFPRQLAMFLSRKLTPHSLPEIGALFGGKDHTTVMHACEKIGDKIQEDSKFKDFVDKLADRIKMY